MSSIDPLSDYLTDFVADIKEKMDRDCPELELEWFPRPISESELVKAMEEGS